MKIIYSEITKFLPELRKDPREVADKLTLIGHMVDGYETKENEEIISLEVRQNRGDCLGYYGLAQELAVAYGLALKTPRINLPKTSQGYQLPIEVKAKKETQRIMALRISNLKNSLSPNWLKKFLRLHDINTVNTLVDLTNLVMLWYGIPCHAFDTAKSGNKLTWELTSQKEIDFKTLDKTKVILPKNSFVISDQKGPASLIMIGGNRAGVGLETTETIIEMAIYDRKKVRLDSKGLNIQTEAGSRLEKELDTELIPQALDHLVKLITDNCGGEISSQVYDYYPQKSVQPKIKLNLEESSDFAGIKIPLDFSLKTFKALGCKLGKIKENNYLITPPTIRKDLQLKEDLIEEIVRFYGYEKIPVDQPINAKKLPEITPPVLKLIEGVKSCLVNLGYDEVRSWPLIQKENLYKSSLLKKGAKPVYTENSINSNYPVLRMSLISSLLEQKKQYKKLKVPDCQIFEVGKIYYQESGKYHEKNSLAIYQPNFKKLEKDFQELPKELGIEKLVSGLEEVSGLKFLEIDLDKLSENKFKSTKLKTKKASQKTIELKKQVIDLDANVLTEEKIPAKELIKKYSKKIPQKYLWKIILVDSYEDKKNKKYKYTLRTYYYNISAQKAKKIHLEAFDLSR